MPILEKYVKPELIILAIALYFAGILLKKSIRVKNKWIPLILTGIGVILASVYMLSVSDLSSVQGVMSALFFGITQGIVCAGMSVYVNQLIKQGGKEE